MELRQWLVTLPCVRDGRVRVDVRGPWPIMLIGMRASRIESQDDAITFVLLNVD